MVKRCIDPAELGGVAEVAAWLGWDRRRVATYLHRGKLPRPLTVLACGSIWSRRQFVDAGWLPPDS
jgi:hypothetical protein